MAAARASRAMLEHFPLRNASLAENGLAYVGHRLTRGSATKYAGMSLEAFIDDVLDIEPWEGQRQIIRSVQENRRTSVASAHGVGKGLALDTPLPTPSGWTTMGNVGVGDELLDESGRPCTVVAVSDVKQLPCYRVMLSDGSSLVTDEDHRWSILRFLPRMNARRGGDRIRDFRDMWNQSETVTTPQLATMLTHHGHRDASIPLAKPLHLPPSPVGNLDPYILGAWLGDGHSHAPYITTADDDAMLAMIRHAGWTVREIVSQRQERARTYRIDHESQNGMEILRHWNLIRNKHIPGEFLRGSEEQRRSLLAGLLDTDGFAQTGRSSVGIDLCHERLAHDVAELVRSLGYMVNVRPGTIRYNDRTMPRWRLSFKVDRPVFGLARKNAALRLDNAQGIRWTHRMVVSVEPVETVPTKCVAVDSPRSLYLAGEAMIPTHNTYIGAPISLAFLHTNPGSIVVTTAPRSQQVRDVMWRYIRTAHRTARGDLRGRPLQVRYEIEDNWYGVGITGNASNTDSMQGIHAESILVIVDEAAGVAESILRTLPAILTGSNSRLLLIGNPTSTSGMFFDSFNSQSHLYNTIQISAYDTPNFTTFGVTRQDMINGAWRRKVGDEPMPYPGLTDPLHVHEDIDEHGIDSEFVKSRVDAVFPDNSSSVLITRAQIDNAERSAEEIPETGRWYAGIDVARSGDDETAVCIRKNHVRVASDAWRGADTMETTGRFRAMVEQLGIPEDQIEVRVDVTGLGAGVYDRLKELGFRSVEWIAGASSSDRVKWRTLKDEAYWQHKERYRLGLIAPAAVWPEDGGEDDDGIVIGAIDDTTRAQMTDIRFSYKSAYTMPVIESKDEAKARGAKSPDRAEAEIICYTDMPRAPKKRRTPLADAAAMVTPTEAGWVKDRGRGRRR